MTLRDRELLKCIIRYCDRIISYSERVNFSRDEFLRDSMVQDACCMCIVQIGELVSLLSEDLKGQHPEILMARYQGHAKLLRA